MRRLVLGLISFFTLSQASLACELGTPKEFTTDYILRKPLRGPKVLLIAGFGPRFNVLLKKRDLHTGIDWSAPIGTPILAAAAGRVIWAGRAGMYGNYVVLDHGGGWLTGYAHLLETFVETGDCVERKANIGSLGASGLAGRPHVHYEIMLNGEFVNPMYIEKAEKVGR